MLLGSVAGAVILDLTREFETVKHEIVFNLNVKMEGTAKMSAIRTSLMVFAI